MRTRWGTCRTRKVGDAEDGLLALGVGSGGAPGEGGAASGVAMTTEEGDGSKKKRTKKKEKERKSSPPALAKRMRG